MKKVAGIWILLMLGMAMEGFCQTDFYAGKWEIIIFGSPMGDIRFTTDLQRIEGKLTGELSYADDPSREKRKITEIEEKGERIVIHFESSQGGDVAIDLGKIDQDNLKGSIMNYDASGKRLKN